MSSEIQKEIKLIKVFYNTQISNYQINELICSEYVKKCEEQIHELSYIDFRCNSKIIDIIEENLKNDKFYGVKITAVPEELKEYIMIRRYDAIESIDVDFNKSYKDLLEKIIEEKTLSNKYIEKYKRIKYIEDCYNDYSNGFYSDISCIWQFPMFTI
jgi:hypothetical protein